MVALRDGAGAPSYALCDQAVTVYHRAARDEIARTVHPRAFLDYRKVLTTDRTGSKEANGFLLVIPGDGDPVAVGDKVMPGEGPECPDDAAWRALIPPKVPGLVVVGYVDRKRLRGRVAHTEAGG